MAKTNPKIWELKMQDGKLSANNRAIIPIIFSGREAENGPIKAILSVGSSHADGKATGEKVAKFSDRGRKVLYVSLATSVLMGYEPEELLAMNFLDIVHPDFRELVGRLQYPWQGQIKIIAKSGEELWLQLVARPIASDSRLPIAFFPAETGRVVRFPQAKNLATPLRASKSPSRDGQVVDYEKIDIIESKPVRKTLELSPSLLQAVLESAADGIIAIAPESQIKIYNQNLVTLWPIPARTLASRDWNAVRKFLLAQLKKPEIFLAREKELSQRPELETNYFLELKDGRVFQWHSQPLRMEKQIVGRAYGFRDATASWRAEEALRNSEAKNRAILNALPDLILRFDKDGTYLECKTAANCETLVPPKEPIGKKIDEVLPREVARDAMQFIAKARGTGETQVFEYQLEVNGSLRDYEARLVVCGANEVLAIVRDTSDRKRAAETIRYQAWHDLLTGLPNRDLYQEQLSQVLAKSIPTKNRIAVMFLDLDRFKTINDTLGHAIGDGLLKQVGDRLTNCLREGDTIARWGGDEFTLLLPKLHSPQDITGIAERILASLKPEFNLDGHQIHITASIGIALYPRDGEDPQTLLRNADAALFRAKEQRCTYQLYAPDLNSQASELFALENSLHYALERKEFILYYQPQVDINTKNIIGVEALVRWQHPQLGMVSPNRFIPLAEETGLIVPIGEWVLRTACQQAKTWQNAGLPAMRIGVNLSARQFQEPNLVQTIARVLAQTGLRPEFLELEITETIAMRDVHLAKEVLGRLKEMGVQLSMDDFGTGYSSLNYLKTFPLHTLKLDRAFVSELTVDRHDLAIATAVITLGRGLELRVVAEGVETLEQLEVLRNLHCQEMQGYLFSPPLPVEKVTKLLEESVANG